VCYKIENIDYKFFDDNELILINFNGGIYYSANKTGGDIWKLIVLGASQAEIVREFVSWYKDSPTDQINSSIKDFITLLIQEGLISVDATENRKDTDSPHFSLPSSGENPSTFETPVLSKYSDMQGILVLDPIHEVNDMGWPNKKEEPDNSDRTKAGDA
jgi:hypothetical protein